MSGRSDPREALRRILGGRQAYAVPGVYDGLGARCAAHVGSRILHATGAGIACSHGYPDIGLVTMTEMLGRVREICAASEVPVIADADTGYGNAVNVHRTVEEFERAGAAGIHIEDQKSPKKCGQLAGKQVESLEESVQKVRAAVAARSDDRFAIIARTDARETAGVDAVIERCLAFADAGADCVFPMALEGEDELLAVAEAVPGPKMITATHGGKTPNLGLERFGQLGYVFVVYAMSPALTAARALLDAIGAIHSDGDDSRVKDAMLSFPELYGIVGIQEYEAWDRRFSA